MVEPKDPCGDTMDRPVNPMVVRRAFGGPYIGNSGYDAACALEGLAEGRLASVSFGQTFIANPDLPRRLREGLPLNPLNASRHCGGGAGGYTDYPFQRCVVSQPHLAPPPKGGAIFMLTASTHTFGVSQL